MRSRCDVHYSVHSVQVGREISVVVFGIQNELCETLDCMGWMCVEEGRESLRYGR